jgi:trk system potassium uptake protein TrkH
MGNNQFISAGSGRQLQCSGLDWAVLSLSPLPMLLLSSHAPHWFSFHIFEALVLLAVAISMSASYFMQRSIALSRTTGLAAIILIYALSFPMMNLNPFYTFLANILFIGLLFFILDAFTGHVVKRERDINKLYCNRAKVSAGVQSVVLFLAMLSTISLKGFGLFVLVMSFTVAQSAFIIWSYRIRIFRNIVVGGVFILFGLAVALLNLDDSTLVLFLMNIITAFLIFFDQRHDASAGFWWEAIIYHPARILFTSFFILCFFGTFLLLLPASSVHGVSLIDAAFTSVSAVCVTGLIVLDTPNDFTLFGQGVILMLIQLGGLGIMTLTTIAIHSLGKRISLKHEAVLTRITDTDHQTLITSLSLILKYTFIFEGIGFALLAVCFIADGDSLGSALWRGLFTSVSAFCNAGFALQSDSLIGYNSNSPLLCTVAILITAGGVAPAVALLLPAWIKREKIPLTAYIAISVSLIMIVLGTLMILVFEWSASLTGLGFGDKLLNAFFQSVTLRTAGFNSVELSNISSPAMLVMLIFMFIGGSPGGTAGGVKTTSIAVLILTFWANITGKNEILINKRRVAGGAVNKAVTVIISGFIVWLIALLMLEITQQIPVRELIFEVTSAIGTVGLSIGGTARLDEIGKIIIILTMFAGRIGAVTLFAFMGKNSSTGTEYLKENITLT